MADSPRPADPARPGRSGGAAGSARSGAVLTDPSADRVIVAGSDTAPSDAGRRAPRRPGLRESTPFTGRAVLLGLVLAGLALTFALPVREYVRQRGEISALQAEKAQREARVLQLQQRLEQWKDPAFVSTQARTRLQYVMPGEVGYVVLDPKEAPAPVVSDQVSAAAVEGTPWYSTLWRSVQAADAPATPAPTKAKPSAAPKPGSGG